MSYHGADARECLEKKTALGGKRGVASLPASIPSHRKLRRTLKLYAEGGTVGGSSTTGGNSTTRGNTTTASGENRVEGPELVCVSEMMLANLDWLCNSWAKFAEPWPVEFASMNGVSDGRTSQTRDNSTVEFVGQTSLQLMRRQDENEGGSGTVRHLHCSTFSYPKFTSMMSPGAGGGGRY